VLVAEWHAFRALDLNHMKAAMMSIVLIDLSSIYGRHRLRSAGSPILALSLQPSYSHDKQKAELLRRLT
jgi:hypothetical protein